MSDLYVRRESARVLVGAGAWVRAECGQGPLPLHDRARPGVATELENASLSA